MSDTKQGGSNNRNQNSNRQGGNRNGNRNGNRGSNNRNRSEGDNRNQNRNRNISGNRSGNRRPAPQPLTFWQKLLAIFGIKPAQQRTASQRPATQSKRTPQESKPAIKKERQPQSVEVTSGRLYVGNLSYETTEYDLEELFKGNGSVKGVEIIYNRHTHKSKGYGFIEMLNVDDAKNAVKVHHDQPFMGRNLIVNGAKNRQTENSDERNDSAA